MSSLQRTIGSADLSSKRRRFQPPITTFFSPTSDPNASSSSSSHVSYNHYSATTHSAIPAVPEKVQASLLSVGMRVRKAVAEGYKTHHAKTEEKLYAPYTKESTTSSHSYPNQQRSELSPFYAATTKPCSHAAGGIQSLPHPANPAGSYPHQITITTDDVSDAFSLPPNSQESTESSDPHPIAQKRSHDADHSDNEPLDDELDPSFEHGSSSTSTWHDPLRLNPMMSAVAPTIRGRTILSPKLGHQRRQFFAATQKQQKSSSDYDDFEEPVFLRRREEVDMDYVLSHHTGDYEVQMGGV